MYYKMKIKIKVFHLRKLFLLFCRFTPVYKNYVCIRLIRLNLKDLNLCVHKEKRKKKVYSFSLFPMTNILRNISIV